DLETSGPLLCATSYGGYIAALLQFALRRVSKEYVCLCKGWFPREAQCLDTPLLYGVHQALSPGEATPGLRKAETQVICVGHFLDPSNGPVSLVEVSLHTGRRHQIRAHLRYEGHPLVGDRAYGSGAEVWCDTLFLHSHSISLDVGAGPFGASLPLPAKLRTVLPAPQRKRHEA
ncbi:unnamed protein product, partial [Effrenium voratum]